jgi:micrococcal nuclease
MYKYNAQVLKVIDGDTVDLFIDLGFKVGFNTRIRLIGIDTPEKNFPYGKVVKDYLINLLEGNKVYLDVTKKDKYGRYLGLVYLNESDNLSVNELLINENMAKAYHGASRADIWTEEELAQTSHRLLK